MNPKKKSLLSPQKSPNITRNSLKYSFSGLTCLPLAQSLLEPIWPHVLVGLQATAALLTASAATAAAIATGDGGRGRTAVGGGGARVLLVLARHLGGDDDPLEGNSAGLKKCSENRSIGTFEKFIHPLVWSTDARSFGS